jgi:hypothetical protein
MLYAQDLDGLVCHKCDCEKSLVYIHSKCHEEAPVWVCYHKDGFLRIECSKCNEEIAKIAVAMRDDSGETRDEIISSQ